MSETRSTRAGITLIAALAVFTGGCRIDSITEKPIETPVSRQQTYSYSSDIKPIFEHKCIACHACYDAPCQLKLTSGEGLLRGASSARVYDGTRLLNASPTRLFIDAHGRAEYYGQVPLRGTEEAVTGSDPGSLLDRGSR